MTEVIEQAEGQEEEQQPEQIISRSKRIRLAITTAVQLVLAVVMTCMLAIIISNSTDKDPVGQLIWADKMCDFVMPEQYWLGYDSSKKVYLVMEHRITDNALNICAGDFRWWLPEDGTFFTDSCRAKGALFNALQKQAEKIQEKQKSGIKPVKVNPPPAAKVDTASPQNIEQNIGAQQVPRRSKTVPPPGIKVWYNVSAGREPDTWILHTYVDETPSQWSVKTLYYPNEWYMGIGVSRSQLQKAKKSEHLKAVRIAWDYYEAKK